MIYKKEIGGQERVKKVIEKEKKKYEKQKDKLAIVTNQKNNTKSDDK